MKFFENFKFVNLFSKKKIDGNLLDKFEELLIESDVGTEIASELKEKLKKGLPTMPTILDDEIECNIFLKAKDVKSFSKLRDLKDNF